MVVFFHYLAMLHTPVVETFAEGELHWIARTPVTLLWNGYFAVLVFFVLSGFVMAAAAHRRADQLITNLLTRYVRLALPATASVLLALVWLTLFPTAARDLADSLAAPSVWLDYTVQGDLPSVWEGLYDGAVGIFVTGESAINNVLWTMKTELFGSVALFAIYWLARGSPMLRLAGLAAFAVMCLTVLRDMYLCFVLGALFYEAHRRDLLARLPVWSAGL
ncbi:MAG: acyltransferase family protein, partial [Alphaproteobacteria bacterium]|nr:acyltransferase family protein [Alphaproteobacteria bacterium]